MTVSRRHPSNSGDAIFFLDLVDKGSNTQTLSSATLPFACQGKCTDQIWRRSFNLHEHTGERYRCCSGALGALAWIWNSRSYLLLVSCPPMFLCRTCIHLMCSFGAAFTSFYRLFGPFRSEVAPQVIKTEIWDTISRRGVMGNVLIGVLPMAFYITLNLTAWILEKFLHMIGSGVAYS